MTQKLSILAASALLVGLAAPGCGGSETRPDERAGGMAGGTRPEDDQGRCETGGDRTEVSEYDTSGDDYPDVRRVFRRLGDGSLTRLVLVCREADLNADGTKDVVRYYNDEGRPMREEADRDFDGQMDMISFFQEGRMIRQEQDTNADGRVDTKIFYENGAMVRTERDLAGRSTATRWQPDRWEYFEEGRMIRMGTDVDGDGTVDRWDRDHELSEQRRAAEAAQNAEDAEDAETEGADDAEGDDAAGDDPTDA